MKRKAEKRKDSTVQTRLSPDDYERFVGHAKAVNRTVADLLREAVNLYLDQIDKHIPLPLDYDDVVEERRTPRHLWGS